ncbi:KDO2-lipid IV(A) lauroyltransferase [Lutimaribacter pacificus]|uniref:KDO2-lipid IV(A) lauroyltransferase n=1 Tax=Lutimaribacter pacificus TaxID=391948 RepID=A0A1H0AS19_9RHOB|nr:lysophospholipid acyltransferase family protein [Lutimaribacter pacificus]SDN35826.1 KDO2-lipid IV(A) lauroyltransferase [Lutimaribacter pacificus]SHJ66120.1 KDO2-lipid IV(A) lauroyltransferase [Lutimaribacter pacificus]
MSAPDLPLPTRLRYFATNLAVRSFFGLALSLPYRWRVPLMGWLASRVIAPVAGWRGRVRRNLAHVMPDLTPNEVERLVRAVPDNAGRTLIEIYSGPDFVNRVKDCPIEGPGLAALEEARAQGRPVILVTAHFGNYDTARAALIARGHNIGSLYRRMRNPYFNAHYVRSISAIGTPMFEQGRRGMMQLVKHLRGGGVLGVLTDLYVGGAPALPFFGQPARTSLVTAELALKYDALLIPTFSIRQANGLDFVVRLEAPIPHTDPETMTRAVNDELEKLVRAHMGQWFWIHRRWKKAGSEDV